MYYSNDVNTLKRYRRNAKNEKKRLSSRKSSVEKAYNNTFGLNSYCSKINKKINDCANELANGIKNLSAVSSKCSAINSKRESQSLTDQYGFSSAMSAMTREIGRCETEIRNLDADINAYERKIKELGGVIMPWE